ncbi:MAG: sulfurtransferase [Gammaproteobacteria bacterium]
MYKTLINSQALHDHLNDPNIIIVDCRYDLSDKDKGKNLYLELHIPGAVFADLHDDLSGPPATDHGRHPLPTVEALEALFVRLGISNDSQVIVYDNAYGSFAGRLWWMLRYMGHEVVAILDGGWHAWLQSGLSTSPGEENNDPGDFQGQPRSEWLVTIDQVPDAEMLIDSRDPARYRGETEPLDRVAGHIPGAMNHFWKGNLEENGLFKDPGQLHEEFQALLGATMSQNAVFYCGSGVTACHNLLAAAHAGLEAPRLYVGSWSEWCADPERPIATGEA